MTTDKMAVTKLLDCISAVAQESGISSYNFSWPVFFAQLIFSCKNNNKKKHWIVSMQMFAPGANGTTRKCSATVTKVSCLTT